MANPDRSGPREMDKPLGTMEEIQRDIQTVRDDLARLAQQVGALLASSGSDALRRARQSLDGVIAEAGEKGLDAVDTVRAKTDTALEALEDAVRQRPFTTLGVALGLGFLFGATWRR